MGGKKGRKWFSISGWGIDLDYCDTEWFTLETNRDHSVVFENIDIYSIKEISPLYVTFMVNRII